MSEFEAGYDGTGEERIRKLIEWDSLLTELRQHPGWAVYQRLADDSIAAYQARLNTGKLDMDDYRFVAGFLDGARQMLAAHEVIAARLKRAREDAEVAGVNEREYAPAVTE